MALLALLVLAVHGLGPLLDGPPGDGPRGGVARWLVLVARNPWRSALGLWALLTGLQAALGALRAGPGLGPGGQLVTVREADAPPERRTRTLRSPPQTHPPAPGVTIPRPVEPPTSMSTSLRDSIVTGPEEVAGLGPTLFVTPCQESFRSGVLLSQAMVVTTTASTIRELSRDGKKVKTILVSGETDPLQHEDFREISENFKEIAKKWFPKARLHLIGYPRFIDSPGRAVALDFYHQVTLRLEAGTQKTYAAMTGEKGEVYKRVITTLSRLDLGNLVIRARFLRGAVDNSTASELRGWIKALEQIKPARIEVCSPKKQFLPKTKPITATRMKEILAEIEEKLGIPVEVIDE